ncbi:MAG: cytochrome c peroxidase, partial [Amylibacter sp.]
MNRLFLILLACLIPVGGFATAIKEAPWLPEAAAYRLTLFLGNQTPIPWDEIDAAWRDPNPAASSSSPAMTRVSGDSAKAIRTALDAKNRQALFATATHMIATRILDELHSAGSALGDGIAKQDLLEAQALYRAFEDGIKAADPKMARALGLAWLELMNSSGSEGVLGAGKIAADTKAFESARNVIAAYLTENYLLTDFANRKILTPLPETAVRSGKEIALPATLPPGSNIADQNPLPRLVLQFEEAGMDEADLPLVAFGDMLFDSPEIFGDPARALGIACSTCHNRSDVNRDFFIPGISTHAGGLDVDSAFFNPMFNDRKADHLDTPSLRGIRFTGPYGRDGREASLRRFTRNVIVTEFAGVEPTPFMLDALIAYMREFDFLPNPKITRYGGLTDLASDAAHRGEALFNQPFEGMVGKSCASCHTPDQKFRDGETYDIGSSVAPFEGGTATPFETPTLLNANFSAPYFHDGALPTLASVVDWFNETKSLGLDNDQKADLTAYLEAVGDGEDPYQDFDDRNTPFRLAFDELTTFATTLDTLIPMRDRENIALLVDTVAADLAAD